MSKKHIHAGLVLTALFAITFSTLHTRNSDVSRAQFWFAQYDDHADDGYYGDDDGHDDPGHYDVHDDDGYYGDDPDHVDDGYYDGGDYYDGGEDFDHAGDLPGHPCGTTHDEDCDSYNTDPGYFEDPNGEYPEEPYYDEPEQPYYDEPEGPYYDEPEQPYYDEPEGPYYDEPEQPYYDEPEGPYYDEPEQPYYDEPEEPYYDEPEQPYYDEPEEPYYDEPEEPHYDEPERRGLCTAEVYPVCGVDGSTYANPCWANKVGVEIAYRGACEEPSYEEPEEPYYDEPEEPYYEEPYHEAPGVDPREEMDEELRQIDEGMREFSQMLKPLVEMGIDETGILRIMQKLANMHKQATRFMEEGDEEAFWNTINDMERIFEDEFMPEVENAFQGSELFAGFQEVSETFNEIKGEVEYLESTGQQVPRVYSQIERTGARIKDALENSDFEKATRLMETLDALFQEYYETVEYEGEYEYEEEYEDEFQYEFQPPAGFEEEVITAVRENPFPDTDITTLEGMAAAELRNRAVIGGFPDGEFKGERPVNRAGAAKFLLLAAGTSVRDLSNKGRFWDVKEGEWYTSFVMTAAEEGIIKGYPDGSFRPADTVNTAEFLKMLSLTFGLRENMPHSYGDVQSDAWFARYAGIAEEYNLFPNRSRNLQPGQDLTRDEVAVAIYQYLTNR